MKMRMRSQLKLGDSGVALILVLLAILVLTTLAAGMVYFARSETLASYNYRIGTQAEYAALAGVQKALNFLKSSSYAPLDPASVTTYYNVSPYAVTPVTLYFNNASPVACTSSCTGGANAVTLKTGTSDSVYPPQAATGTVNVIANWAAAMNNQTITDGMGGTGTYSVTAKLLEYHTVNNAFYGTPAAGCTDASAGLGICRQPYEVWEITATGTWSSNIGGGSASPTVRVVATISPMYLSYFGNALYGLCNVTMSGTKLCTDAYNSGAGAYGATATDCVTPTTGTSNAVASGSGIGSNGGIDFSGSPYIGGNVTFANLNSNASCNTGFSGSTTNVAGSVMPGPAIPPPPDIRTSMTGWGYPTTTPGATPTGMGGVVNVHLRRTTPPPLPPGVAAGLACPAGATGYIESYIVSTSKGANTYGSYSCVALSGSGTSTDPYRLGDVAVGSTSNTGTVNIISPTNPPTNPVYVAMNNISISNNGIINTSYAAPATPATGTFDPNSPLPTAATATSFVFDVRNAVDIGGGTANLNYNSASPGVPSPVYMTLNVMGTGNALNLSGQAQLSGTVNVPNGDADLGGSGASGTFFGSIIANNIRDHGNYPIHYDLAARNTSGQIFVPQIVSMTRPKF